MFKRIKVSRVIRKCRVSSFKTKIQTNKLLPQIDLFQHLHSDKRGVTKIRVLSLLSSRIMMILNSRTMIIS